MYDIVAIGEMLIDFTTENIQEDGYPIMAAHPGGAVANFIAPASKYGRETAIISSVGNDAFGNMLIKTLKDLKIETKGINIAENAFTTLAFVTRDKNGDREFSFVRKPGADILLSETDAGYSIIDKSKVVHFGTVGMTEEPSRTTHKKYIEYAKKNKKIISFDPNLRVPLWKSLDGAKEQILWGISVADFMKISDNEVEFLFGLKPEEGAKYIIENFGVSLVFVTCGKDGCVFATEKYCGKVPNFQPKEKTIDTTGAGDIFGGSAMYKIIESGKKLDEFSESELFEIGSFACKAASISTTHLGGISSVPNLCEIQ